MVEQKNVALLVTAFAALLIGIGLLSSLAVEEQSKTTFKTVNNELINLASARNVTIGQIELSQSNFTLANAPTGWKQEECPIVDGAYTNDTTKTFTENTDYKVYNSIGVLQVLNTSSTYNSSKSGNLTYFDYQYCGDDYITESWTRTVLGVVIGFFAIALLLISVGIIYAVLKSEGILNI